MKRIKLIISIFFAFALIISLPNHGDKVIEVVNDGGPKKSDLLSVSPIYINGSSDWVIFNSTHDWCYGTGTKEDPYVIENIIINGGITNNCISIYNSNVDNTIRNCTFFNASAESVIFKNISNGILEKNNILNNPGHGIYLDSCINVSILSNNIYNNDLMGIVTTYCNYTKIIHNNISNSRFGIYIWMNNYDSIIDNSLLYNLDHGLYLKESNFVNISRNIDNYTTDGIGIYLDFCNNATVTKNEACHNDVGIYARGESCYVASNNLRNNSGGLMAQQSYYSTYYKNLIINNTHGIYVDRSTNTFYFNYLDNINDNIYEDISGTNNWDNGTIGNYYSNYTGLDLNGDGIGEDPYYINGRPGYIHGPDNYPIVWQKPLFSVLEPLEGTTFTKEAPSVNVLILQGKIISMWYTINNNETKYYFYSNTTIQQSAWNLLSNGSVKITFYIEDIFGFTNSAQIIIYKDTRIINIIHPTTNEVFEIVPFYEITITEANLDKIWYTFNSGMNKVFITELMGVMDLNLWNQLPNGYVTIRFYVNDTLGNISFNEVIVVKDTPSPPPRGIPGYNLFALIGIISLMAVIAIKFNYHKKIE